MSRDVCKETYLKQGVKLRPLLRLNNTTYSEPDMDKVRQKLLKCMADRNIEKIKNIITKYGQLFSKQELEMLEKYDKTYTIELINIKNLIGFYKKCGLSVNTVQGLISGRLRNILDNIDIFSHRDDILDIAHSDIYLILINSVDPDITSMILSNTNFTPDVFNRLLIYLTSTYPAVHTLKYQLEENTSFIERVDELFSKCVPAFGLELFDSIVANASFCKKFRNSTDLIGDSWEEVFADNSSNNIVYFDKKSGYGFLISSLLNYWNTKFNSCNHLITPSLPTNPYTNENVSFDEVYKISYISLRYGVSIPKTIKQLLMFPELMDRIRAYSIKYTNHPDQEIMTQDFTRDQLKNFNFKYMPISSRENDEGEWVQDDELIKDLELTETKLKLYYIKYQNGVVFV